MAKTYFKNVLKALDEDFSASEVQLNFIVLKGYEYWLRALRCEKRRPDAEDSLSILPRKNAENVLTDVMHHFESRNKITESTQKRAVHPKKFPVEEFDFEDEDDGFQNDYSMPVAYNRRKKTINAIRNFIEGHDDHCEASRIGGKYLDNESIFDGTAKKIFYDSFQGELVKILTDHAEKKEDSFLRRIKILKKTFNLSEQEMEIALFAWIFFNKEICEHLCGHLKTQNRFGSTSVIEIFPRLYPNVDIEKTLSNDGTLKKMHILEEDLDISRRIGFFLDGSSGDDLDSLYCQTYQGNCVPYSELSRGKPEVELMYEMLKNNPAGKGLNIFLYGVEGTGKTELAKSIAKELGRPLVMTVVRTEGSHKGCRNNSVLSERMGSVLFAANKFNNQKVILLVDEADLILNSCEKGALNFFLEQIKVPVIWISNETQYIEASSLRRFDYSIQFERPDAETRLGIWNSVIKEQKAEDLLSPDMVETFATEFPITAGGITQAISGAKMLKESGCSFDTSTVVRQIATAQADLMGLPLEYASRDKESHSPKYMLDVLNIDNNLERIQRVLKSFDDKWKTMRDSDRPDSLNVLFYGAPGTGKTELAKYVARNLGRKLLIRKASDILGYFVGETEKKIRAMFREAEDKKAILFLDEADSMLQERGGANHTWEVSQVNELLTQMENFKGIFIAATNFNGNLDQASRRRFALKVKFNYLKPEGIETLWNAFFAGIPCPAEARNLKALAPGDFNAVYSSFRFLDDAEKTPENILQALEHEINSKDTREGRRMGL